MQFSHDFIRSSSCWITTSKNNNGEQCIAELNKEQSHCERERNSLFVQAYFISKFLHWIYRSFDFSIYICRWFWCKRYVVKVFRCNAHLAVDETVYRFKIPTNNVHHTMKLQPNASQYVNKWNRLNELKASVTKEVARKIHSRLLHM